MARNAIETDFQSSNIATSLVETIYAIYRDIYISHESPDMELNFVLLSI